MKVLLHIWLAYSALLGANYALAGEYEDLDGKALLEECREVENLTAGATDLDTTSFLRIGSCTGYLQGFREGFWARMGAEQAFSERKVPEYICIPKGFDNGQAASLVVRYLEENPSMLDEPKMSVVLSAFIKAFSC